MKTVKAFRDRIKVTKTGKLKSRPAGQNHFNAKEGGQSKLSKKGYKTIDFSNKTKSRFVK